MLRSRRIPWAGMVPASGPAVRVPTPAAWIAAAALAAALAAACSGGGPEGLDAPSGAAPAPGSEKGSSGSQGPAGAGEVALLDDPAPDRLTAGWETNFDIHSVPYAEIVSGGLGRDGISPVDSPVFFVAAEAPGYMEDAEPVIALEIGGSAKAYPLTMLMRHEIVNDELASVPVAVTYCPLCNTALVFDRRAAGLTLDFGTTGNLRRSDLLMWDRQTQSWWQQISADAIVGDLTGTRLRVIAAQVVSFADFAVAHPDGLVLSRETGIYPASAYEVGPYPGYDAEGALPLLFDGEVDGRLAALERVLAIEIGDESAAYPFARLAESPVINDSVGGERVVIFYVGGTLSPFPGGSEPRRAVGSTGVFEPEAEGRELTFSAVGGAIVDDQTGSVWSILGRAVSGPLEGTQLTAVAHGNHFWFAWAAFRPDTHVRGG